MSGIELGKADSAAGAWAWKLLENPFIDFLKRRWEDAKSDSEKAQYLQARWNEFDWGKAAERYKERMKANYGHIRVLGSAEPKGLDDLFTDVNVLEKPLAFRRFDVTKLYELQKEPEKLLETKRISGLRLVTQNLEHRLYILGGPGAGKTTFLKYLVFQTIKGGLDKIPIFITIKDWADTGKSVLDFISQQFDICRFPNSLPFIEFILDIGKVIILFDGLDEVKQEANLRSRITTELHNFTKKYSKTQAIVTCRVAASDYSFTDFTYLEISDFSDRQIRAYASKWFGNSNLKGKQFLEELDKPDNSGVLDLSRSPLLLSLICLAYDETLHIPQRRVELYEEALDALLKRWDASRNILRDEIKHPGQAEAYKKLSLGRKKQLFARIAAETFEKGEIFFHNKILARQIEDYFKGLPPVDDIQEIDGEVILHAIEAQHGILTEVAQGIYSFSHLTFQEYYTAKYIADNAPSTWEGLARHVYDPRWREILLLVSSLPDEADNFLRWIIYFITEEISKDLQLINFLTWIDNNALLQNGYSQHPSLNRCNFIILELSKMYENLTSIINNGNKLHFCKSALDYANSLKENLIVAFAITSNDIQLNYLETDPRTEVENTLFNILDLASSITRAISREAEMETKSELIIDLYQIMQIDGYEEDFPDPEKSPIKKFHANLQLSFKKAIELSRVNKLSDLAEKLESITIPEEKDIIAKWYPFHDLIQGIVADFQHLPSEWDFSTEQFFSLYRYFLANILLLECFDVSYLRDRETLLKKLLSPQQVPQR